MYTAIKSVYFSVYHNLSLILITDIYFFNTPNAVHISEVYYTQNDTESEFLSLNVFLTPIPLRSELKLSGPALAYI